MIPSPFSSTLLAVFLGTLGLAGAREIHVSPKGDDSHDGAPPQMLRSISAAAKLAMPGDMVTVHEGIYRERIDPPRGGESGTKRITYQAATGEKVSIKGSEVIKDWEKGEHQTWKVTLPNRFFGDFNPYKDLIKGDWFSPLGREHHTGAVYLDGHWLTEAATQAEVMKPIGKTPLWFAKVDDKNTTIWAQFETPDPNQGNVEINVRQAVFYPSKPGRNHITVRGFTLEHAATPWSPPTAEQIGLIGTHWSKGWNIENNVVRYSTCTGITLGKHGDEFDNKSQDSATGYVETIKRGLARGWCKENIGSHRVAGNHISHCEQAGIVGSLGPIFCIVEENIIHDIHVRHLFHGAEMAGIKFHAPIDTLIRGNHIYRTTRGIWLDWMTQGTRVTGNLLHDNYTDDLFVEVNHGPFLIDNNLFLSKSVSLKDQSEGGTYAHNIFVGKFFRKQELKRETPWQEEHGTKIAGLSNTQGGDNRFYNNLFIGEAGLELYDDSKRPDFMAGNVFLNGAKPSKHEESPLVIADFDPGIRFTDEHFTELEMMFDKSWNHKGTQKYVTSEMLGRAMVTGQAFLLPDGSPIDLPTDYFGIIRDPESPFPGPFEIRKDGVQRLPVSTPPAK